MAEKGKDVAGAANPRGIPQAPFVDRVEDYVSSRDEVEQTLRNFQEMISCVMTGLSCLEIKDAAHVLTPARVERALTESTSSWN
jgi:hypothetical protein